MKISLEEKKILVETARAAINEELLGTKFERIELADDSILKVNAGAFVTLTIDGRLRGCVGYIFSDNSIYDTVCDAAVSAAIHDTRFPTLTPGEIDMISIEVSILSPKFKLDSYDDIIIGKHGLILEEGYYRGLLLPQVPIEHNMNREQYLDAICQKSGLPHDYWRNNKIELYGFTATVFSEMELEKNNEISS